MKKVGILALQGDFSAHERVIAHLGAAPFLVRHADHFKEIDGLILPGGESTAMLKLLHYDNLMTPLHQFASKKPVFGTCAGAILLAKKVTGPSQESLNILDITIERNAYGRQNESRITEIETEAEFQKDTNLSPKIEAVFIRAPIIRQVGNNVRVLARYKGDPVLVEEGFKMAATFHPELTADLTIHSFFLSKLA